MSLPFYVFFYQSVDPLPIRPPTVKHRRVISFRFQLKHVEELLSSGKLRKEYQQIFQKKMVGKTPLAFLVLGYDAKAIF